MNKKIKDQIPGKNATREELAKFWDTHSFAEYWDEFKPVNVEIAKNLKHEVRITLDSKEMKKLDEQASKKKTNAVLLAREWILEQLQ